MGFLNRQVKILRLFSLDDSWFRFRLRLWLRFVSDNRLRLGFVCDNRFWLSHRNKVLIVGSTPGVMRQRLRVGGDSLLGRFDFFRHFDYLLYRLHNCRSSCLVDWLLHHLLFRHDFVRMVEVLLRLRLFVL